MLYPSFNERILLMKEAFGDQVSSSNFYIEAYRTADLLQLHNIYCHEIKIVK